LGGRKPAALLASKNGNEGEGVKRDRESKQRRGSKESSSGLPKTLPVGAKITSTNSGEGHGEGRTAAARSRTRE